MYEHDMSKESEKVLLPEGDRQFRISDIEEAVSKSGNDMFIFKFEDLETGSVTDVYAIAAKGKRWFLKQILTACGIEAGQDGVYKWDFKDVKNRVVSGSVVHEESEWTNRDGKDIITKKHKIQSVKIAMEE